MKRTKSILLSLIISMPSVAFLGCGAPVSDGVVKQQVSQEEINRYSEQEAAEAAADEE